MSESVLNALCCLSTLPDTVAVAGIALQCLRDAETPVTNKGKLVKALVSIRKQLLDSQRADGHLGNEFSTGLAVQVRFWYPFSTKVVPVLVRSRCLISNNFFNF